MFAVFAKYFTILFTFSLVTAPWRPIIASTTDGTIDIISRYAWSENAGWIDFGVTSGNIHVTDTELAGYAYGENIGWISLNCSNTSSCGTVNFKVSNDNEGNLSGFAWSENAGWIDFDPAGAGVTINSFGEFSGLAYGENIGWICFNCASTNSCSNIDYRVRTDWRPATTRDRIFFEITSDIIAQIRNQIGNRALDLADEIQGLTINKHTGRIIRMTKDPVEVIALIVYKYEKYSFHRNSLIKT